MPPPPPFSASSKRFKGSCGARLLMEEERRKFLALGKVPKPEFRGRLRSRKLVTEYSKKARNVKMKQPAAKRNIFFLNLYYV